MVTPRASAPLKQNSTARQHRERGEGLFNDDDDHMHGGENECSKNTEGGNSRWVEQNSHENLKYCEDERGSSRRGAGGGRKERRKPKMVKADRERRMLLGNGDEMLMCLILMHCSKVSEEGEAEREEREGRGWADWRNREARKTEKTEIE